jgi:hypothetical protein
VKLRYVLLIELEAADGLCGIVVKLKQFADAHKINDFLNAFWHRCQNYFATVVAL